MPELPNWPYLTGEMPGLTGKVKVRPEDFLVEEIPRYACCGEGDHTYFLVEKSGITTLDLVRKLSHALGRNERQFGYAGLKDSQAVTRQYMSIEHVEPNVLKDLSLPNANVRILSVNRHTNKIKLGHLAGNKFVIKIREPAASARAIAEPCLATLLRRGVPNYFGHQRFGIRADNWLLGRAIMTNEHEAFVDRFCGRPMPMDKDMVRRARQLYDRGQYELAAEVWPGYFRDAKRACRILARDSGSHFRAFMAIDRKLKRLFVSAYQSYLFNQVLAERIDGIDRILAGDLACKHVNGAVFLVVDEPTEQARAEMFEISPSGPLYGYRMSMPQGRAGEIEKHILDNEGLTLDDFRRSKWHKVKGSRRPIRVRITDLAVDFADDEHGPFLQLSFRMPAGAYATAVLRELMKQHLLTHHLAADNEKVT